MQIDLLLNAFSTGYYFSDIGLPREEQQRVRVLRFITHVKKIASTLPPSDQTEAENLAFIMERLYQKLPDANEEILVRLSIPLLPDLEDWIKNKLIPPHHIGVRVKIDPKNLISTALCNHGGPDGCDCGDHPKK